MSNKSAAFMLRAPYRRTVEKTPTVYVTKKNSWLRFKTDGETISKDDMLHMESFKMKYNKVVTPEEIEKIEAEWKDKLIKENV